MIIDIGLAFLEGLALIVSPCILPVLPLVLATSVEGGKRRPYGIIIGFVLAFSLFALVSRQIVQALGVDLDIIKNASLVLLALFGLVLLSSKLSEKFSALTQGAANFGNELASRGGEGLLSGVMIGALIGLVWTPCAGPILAAVLVQVIRQETQLAGNLIIVSFAIGAGVPMLIIALTGRKVMNKLGFLTRHAEAVRRGFGVLILLSVAYIASGAGCGIAAGEPQHQSRAACRRAGAAGRPGHTLRRAGIRRHRGLDQFESAHHAGPERQGGADRFLDLFLHQLRAHPALHHRLGQ